MDYAIRQKKLAIELGQAGVDALLITHLPNIRYLCGFTGSAGALLVANGGRGLSSIFYTDGRYTQQAREEVQGARVVIAPQGALREACEREPRATLKVLWFESEQLS